MRILGIVILSVTLAACGISPGGRDASRRSICRAERRRARNEVRPGREHFQNGQRRHFLHWQLGDQTNIYTDRGSGIASTNYCKVSVIASKIGIVSQLNTEDANAGGGVAGALGMYGSICAHWLRLERQS